MYSALGCFYFIYPYRLLCNYGTCIHIFSSSAASVINKFSVQIECPPKMARRQKSPGGAL